MILVTGATGFIGSHLLCHLAEKDIFPVAMFRHESNKARFGNGSNHNLMMPKSGTTKLYGEKRTLGTCRVWMPPLMILIMFIIVLAIFP